MSYRNWLKSDCECDVAIKRQLMDLESDRRSRRSRWSQSGMLLKQCDSANMVERRYTDEQCGNITDIRRSVIGGVGSRRSVSEQWKELIWKESQAHQVLIIDSNLHTSQLISTLSELCEILRHTVALVAFDVSEFIFECQLSLVALALE